MNASAAASRTFTTDSSRRGHSVAAQSRQEWIQSSLSEDELQALMGDDLYHQPARVARLHDGACHGAFLLLALHALSFYFNREGPVWQLMLCAAYLMVTLGTRLLITPGSAGQARFEWCWPVTLGLDLLVYFAGVVQTAPWPTTCRCAGIAAGDERGTGTKRITILTVVTSSALIGGGQLATVATIWTTRLCITP